MPQAAAPSPSPSSIPAAVQGGLWMILASIFFTAMGAMGRHVGGELHPIEVTFFRTAFGLLFLLPWLLRGVRLRTRHLRLHMARAAAVVVALASWFLVLTLMPLAQVMAIGFTVPLFATAGAALFLKERVGPRRWSAIVVGFIGTLVILRPGADMFTVPALLALGNAVLIAFSALVVKSVSRDEDPDTMVLYFTGLMAVFSLPAALFVWTIPLPSTWGWLAAIGLVATLAQMSFVRAFRAADASVVLPFDYFKLLVAAIIGYIFFAEVPDLFTWIGGTITFAATLYTTQREARLERMRRAA
jgi:drug/metabolite transporter (DMT)-like permease